MEFSSSKEMLNYYIEKAHTDAVEGRKRGEPVCWASSISPCEFCEAMGIHMVYPENHAAQVAASGKAGDLLQEAENKGYSQDICSYARINLSGLADLPAPDFVLVCNNICNTLLKWYENLSRKFDVPMIIIDVPYNYDDEVSDRAIDYIADQIVYAIRKIEEITGRTLDEEKFEHAMQTAIESSYWWMDAMDKVGAVPSPMNGFSIFSYMALIVCMRANEGCRDTFKKLSEELQENIDKGKTAYKKGEKVRCMWEGIAVWPHLLGNMKTFRKLGINIAGSTYPAAWALQYEKGNLRSMARAYTSVASNMSLANQIAMRAGFIKKYNCDAMTYHLNKSCKLMDLLQPELQKGLSAETHLPYVQFDGDQADPGGFNQAQFDIRMQGLSEIVEAKKANEKS